MGRNKGICTLCGKGGPLTFEHVPPEGGLNIRGVLMYTFDDWMRRETLGGPLPNGIPQPEGMGLIALCPRCNRFLGREYVPSHIRLVRAGREVLVELAPRLGELDARLVTTAVSLRLSEVDRLACAKQIVSMILVTSGRDIVKAHPALELFVRHPRVAELPSSYRLFLALAPGPNARTTGVCIKIANDVPQVVAEIVYPPFAYALTFSASCIWPVGEITSWVSAPFGESTTIAIDLAVGFTHTGFPCDLRTRAQVEADIRENDPRSAALET